MNNKKKLENFNDESSSFLDNKFIENFIIIQNVKTGTVFGDYDSGKWVPITLVRIGGIALEPEADIEQQKYIIYPLDNNQFMIVKKRMVNDLNPNADIFSNHGSGTPIILVLTSNPGGGLDTVYTISAAGATNLSFADDPKGLADQKAYSKFNIVNTPTNHFQIRDSTFLGYIIPDPNPNRQLVGYSSEDSGDTSNNWDFKPVESIQIPTAPSFDKLETFPKYTSLTDNLPDETPKRLTGWTKVPAYFIEDNNVIDGIKVDMAPYYVIEKYQYWKKVETVSLAPGESREDTYTTGTNTTIMNSMDKSTNMTIGTDAGLKFDLSQDKSTFGGTTDLKQTITNGLDIKESTTTDTMTESRETNTQRNPFDKQSMIFSKYQLATELRYICPSKNEYDPDILIDSWTFVDESKSNITSFPSQEAISAELNKKGNQSHINPSLNAYLKF